MVLGAVGFANAQSTQESCPAVPPAESRAGKLDVPKLDDLADQLVKAYQALECMSFEVSVTQEGVKDDGEFVPLKEAAWARVYMCGPKLRLQVFRREGGEHLLDFIDDGKKLTEVTARERVETPLPAPDRGRSLYLDESVDFDGCRVGHLLQSWLAPRAAGENTVFWAARHIRTGKYLGIEEVEGKRCHAVRFRVGAPGPESVVTDFTLYLDIDNCWMRKRVASQRVFDRSGDIFQIVRRSAVYRNISLDHVPEDIFVPPELLVPQGGTTTRPQHIARVRSSVPTTSPADGRPGEDSQPPR